MKDRSSGRAGEPFFLFMALALLGVVLGGFSSSFYFRDDSLPPLPADLQVHGVVLTLWFGLAVVQSALISVGRNAASVRLHRRLGIASCVVASGVVWTGIAVAIDFYRSGAGDIVVPAPALLFANLVNVLGFAICVVSGVALRRRSESHKRFMTWASLVIIGPASFRLVRDLGFSPVASVPAQFLFVALLFGHDYRQSSRIHGCAWIGLAIVLFQIGGSFTFGKSELWARLAEDFFASR